MENNNLNMNESGAEVNAVPAPPQAYENPTEPKSEQTTVSQPAVPPQFIPQPPVQPQYAPQPQPIMQPPVGYPAYNRPPQAIPQPVFTPTPAATPAAAYEPTVHAVAPVNPAIPTKKSGKGLAAFILAVAFVLVLAIGAGIGYVMSGQFQGFKGQQGQQNNVVPNVELVPKPENGEEYTIESIYNVASQSVVRIAVYNDESAEYSMASGVIYTEDGYIVTNDHIYEEIPNAKFIVETYDGRQFEGVFVAGDMRSDLAVLKIEGSDLKPAVFGDSDQLAIGELVVAVGNPDGAEVSVATSGIVSAVDIWVQGSSTYSTRLIQTDAALNPGSSGGALVNAYGQVIGITSSKIIADDTDLVNYAIPTSVMKRVVDSLIENGYVTGRAKLGITYVEIGSMESAMSGYPSGIYIDSVEPGSKLYAKGLEKDDIITHVNGEEITSASVMLSALENTPVGTQVTLTVYREGQGEFQITTELEEYIGSSSYQTLK